MLQSEFYDRTGMVLSASEWEKVNDFYMRSDLDKDAFCAKWREMMRAEIEKQQAKRKALQDQAEKENYLINRVCRFVWSKKALPVCNSHDEKFTEMQSALAKVLGKYQDQDARRFIIQIENFYGVVSPWYQAQWRKYEFVKDAVLYGL